MSKVFKFSADSLGSIIESLANPVFIKNEKHQWILVNDAFCKLMGNRREDLIGKSDFDFFPEHEARVFWQKDEETMSTMSTVVNEENFTDADGQIHWILTRKSAYLDPDHGVVLCGVITDITSLRDTQKKLEQLNNNLQQTVDERTADLKALNERLETLAYTDNLTRLPNRACLELEITATISRTKQADGRFALCYLDIDDLKAINDSYGHPVGDLFITQLARRASAALNPDTFMARIGGDEFMVILPFSDLSEVTDQADQMVQRFNEPLEFDNRLINVTASIGITLFPDHGEDITTLIKHADCAMYESKAHHRGNYTFFREELAEQANRKLLIESSLRRSLKDSTLIAHFQSVVDCVTDRVVGYESLARIEEPDYPNYDTEEMISIAEQSGLIHELGQQMLEQACLFIKSHCQNDEFVTLNISSPQLLHADFTETVESAVLQHRINPNQLVLEITETVMAQLGKRLDDAFTQLDALGVHLWIDDFGTGYSSLSQLKNLDIDTLKIDRTFITDLPHSSADQSLVKTMIDIADDFDLKIIAEGVETSEQRELLARMGIRYQQGFLYSRPEPSSGITTLQDQSTD